MRRTYQERAFLILVLVLIALPCGVAAEETAAPTPSGPSATPLGTVRDFGAVGDGVADDTAALQKAVDAGIGDVILPRGVYRISKPIVVDLDKVGWTSVAGLAGTALFAQLHDTLIPILYDPTNVGQITLTDLFGNYAAAVAVLAVGFSLCTWGIGKLWGPNERAIIV